MALMRTRDSSITNYDRKLHVLLTIEVFTKSVIIYTLKQNSPRRVRMEQNLFQNISYKNWGKPQNIESVKLSK